MMKGRRDTEFFLPGNIRGKREQAQRKPKGKKKYHFLLLLFFKGAFFFSLSWRVTQMSKRFLNSVILPRRLKHDAIHVPFALLLLLLPILLLILVLFLLLSGFLRSSIFKRENGPLYVIIVRWKSYCGFLLSFCLSVLDNLCNGKFHRHLQDLFAPLVVRYVDLMESSIAQSIHRGFERESWEPVK